MKKIEEESAFLLQKKKEDIKKYTQNIAGVAGPFHLHEVADKISTDYEQNRKEKLLSKAPKLPFDVDLYHWEEENPKASFSMR